MQPSPAPYNGNIREEKKSLHSPRRSRLFFIYGILCYGLVLILCVLKEHIISSILFTHLSISLALCAEFLWSIPSALIGSCLLLLISWGYYYVKIRGKQVRYIMWLGHPSLPSCIMSFLILLFFIYTILPLRWAQRYLTRSPDSVPDYTPFGSVIMLLSLAGTIFCFLYCAETLPLRAAHFTQKITTRFFKMKAPFFLMLLLVLCLTTTGIIAYTVLHHIPHVVDSIAQLFHAKIFKMGKLYAPLPPHKEFFDYLFIINDSRWYSQYPPGHSLLLMLGLFLKTPWLIGPVMGTFSLCIFFLLVQHLYRDRQITYLSTMLLLLSPFFLFMSSSYMNHTSTMFFILSFLYCYTRMCSSHAFTPAFVSGLSLGYAITIRPLTAVAIGIPFICDVIISTYKKREITIRKAIFFFTGLSLMVLLLLLYNDLTNGSPFLFGYQKKHHTLGFIGNAQEGQPHTLKGGVINTSNNLIGLNEYLFEWPVPSLIFIFILFLLPLKKNRWDYLFLSSSLTLIMSYFFYYYQDFCFGPRFYYCLTPLLIILTVRGFYGIPHWLEKKGFNQRTTEASLYFFLLLCSFSMLSFNLPPLVRKYSNDYWWVTDKIHHAVKQQGITNAIVFIDCWYPLDTTTPNLIYYGSGFQCNSPDLKDDVIYALDLKERNVELMRSFPHRNYYRCNFFWERSIIAW
jgi:hypothetical protein